ncbi:MAG: hypothetical protein QM711_08590 [Micropruina sp.]|uniref:hypothetical protein n=1 Tax=Micropruina sp. TaxID=2737536 RepID=UPI0039E258E2
MTTRMFLHRVSIRPRHLQPWLQLWPAEVALRSRNGFTTHQAYLQENAEPKLTWLYSPSASGRRRGGVGSRPRRPRTPRRGVTARLRESAGPTGASGVAAGTP